MASLPFGLSSLRGYEDREDEYDTDDGGTPVGGWIDEHGFDNADDGYEDDDNDSINNNVNYNDNNANASANVNNTNANRKDGCVTEEGEVYLNVLADVVYTVGCHVDEIPSLSYALLNILLATSAFVSVTQTHQYLSLVVEGSLLPLFAGQEEKVRLHPHGWRVIEISDDGQGGTAGIVGGLSPVLAKAGVSIYYISTYATDYVLVQEDRLADAVSALSAAFNVSLSGSMVANPGASPDLLARFQLAAQTHPLPPSNAGPSGDGGSSTMVGEEGEKEEEDEEERSITGVTWPRVAEGLRIAAVPMHRFLSVIGVLVNELFNARHEGGTRSGKRFFSLTHTSDEVSLLLEGRVADQLAQVPELTLWSHAWVPVRVDGNVGGNEGFKETGVVARVSSPLCATNIPAFHLSAFEQHYSLVRHSDKDRASQALESSLCAQ